MADRVHIIDPDAFVRSGKEWPWCGHGRYVPLVEMPEDATCQLCLGKYAKSLRPVEPEPCSMCRQRPATTSWGFPVCQPCADWLTRLDADLSAEFGEQRVLAERYIDRARRAIRQRRLARELAVPTDDDQSTPSGEGTTP